MVSSQNPDDVVPQVQDVKEVPSKLIAEAQLRHEEAKKDTATPQEKKQAAVEEAHALDSRPDGSYAQLHETDPAQQMPTLAVADDQAKDEGRESIDAARKDLTGAAPAGSEAARKAETDAADARTEAATRSDSDTETRPANSAAKPSGKAAGAK